MKGFVIALFIIAGLVCWGWYNFSEVSRLEEQNVMLKKSLADAEAAYDKDKSTWKNSLAGLTATEIQLSAAGKRIAVLEKQLSDKNAEMSAGKIDAPQPVPLPAPAVTAAPAAAVPTAEQIAATARTRQQQSEISELKAQAAALTSRQQDLQRKISAINNKLMSGGGRETGWYYIYKNGAHGDTHPMSDIPSTRQRVQWLYESKEATKAREAAPFETELISVNAQKAQIEAKITQKQLAKE